MFPGQWHSLDTRERLTIRIKRAEGMPSALAVSLCREKTYFFAASRSLRSTRLEALTRSLKSSMTSMPSSLPAA